MNKEAEPSRELKRPARRSDRIERYLSREYVMRRGFTEKLVDWLAERYELLPILGEETYFIRQIAQMDPADRREFLRDLAHALLSPEERVEWQELRQDLGQIADRMIAFWKARR